MKKTIIFMSLLAVSTLVAFKKAPHGTDTISPKVEPFESIVIDCGLDADVQLQENSTPSVTFTGDQEMLDYIKTRVSGKKLIITYEGHFRTAITHNQTIHATITMPVLSGMDVTGSAVVNVRGNAKNEKLKSRVSGSGMIEFEELNVKEFLADQSGSGHIEAKTGTVGNGRLINTGSGSIKVLPVNMNEATAENTGSGSISLSATHQLAATETGSGSIKFKGHPEVFSQDVTGSGSIRRVD